MKSKHASQLGPLSTVLLLLAVFGPLVWLVKDLHYRLPESVEAGTSLFGRPQFSELLARSHIQALENAGYRIVGTPEHVAGRDYVLAEVERLADICRGVDGLECEVELQRGNGSHRFDILNHSVLKTYSGLTNVLLRISNGTQAAKESTLLLNAHIDSQLPGPGAADDAIGVGIMLELARVLVERGETFQNSVLFLFNNAEESLQDASHLFSTQSHLAKTVKAFVNLEAAGTKGAEMLFQSGSDVMLRAYSKVPHPHGTVLAADVFSSGIIGSDTDYGQFESYLNISGLDLAIVDHSWYYHTSKDTLANLERGSTQHFGENVLAIVDELLGKESELSGIEIGVDLRQDYVYFSLLDRVFIKYSLETARKASICIFAALAILVLNRSEWRAYKAYLLALVAGVGSLVGALVAANAVAVVMWKGLDRSMSWYSSELLPLGLYAPVSLLGMLLPQLALSHWISPLDRPTMEHATFTAWTTILSGLMTLATQYEIKSGFLLAILTGSQVVGMGCSEGLGMLTKRARGEVHLAGYVVAQLVPAAIGTITSLTVLSIFVPLTGRMGVDVPVELIIANLSALLVVLFTPVVLPLFHRFDRGLQAGFIWALVGTTVVSVGVFARSDAFSSEAPRRIFLNHEYNVSSDSFSMHLAQMDIAPHASALFEEIHSLVDVDRTHPMLYSARDQSQLPMSWDYMNPVQAFFETFHFAVDRPPESGKLPTLKISTLKSTFDERTSVRDVTLQIDHPGLIWPVLAFDAEIVSWPFNTPPLAEHTRHHLKGVSEEGYESYELSISVRGPGPIHMEWIGLVGDGMMPATAPKRGHDLPGFGRLDAVWEFFKTRPEVDALVVATVVGVAEV